MKSIERTKCKRKPENKVKNGREGENNRELALVLALVVAELELAAVSVHLFVFFRPSRSSLYAKGKQLGKNEPRENKTGNLRGKDNKQDSLFYRKRLIR